MVVRCGYLFVVLCCGYPLWLCVVDVSLRLLCVCDFVFVVVFVVMCLWFCVVVLCLWLCVVVVFAVMFVIACLWSRFWLCVCGCIFGCVAVLWLCVYDCLL